jgi:hypothetical protein
MRARNASASGAVTGSSRVSSARYSSGSSCIGVAVRRSNPRCGRRAPRSPRRPLAAEVMGLVDEAEVPAGGGDLPDLFRRAREELEAGDDAGKALPGRGLGILAAAPGEPVAVHQGEQLLELVKQLGQPLHREVAGGDHQHPRGEAGEAERGEDHSPLDGLPQPHLVGENEPGPARREHPLHHRDLMELHHHPAREQRPQRVVPSLLVEPQGLPAEEEGGASATRPSRRVLSRSVSGAARAPRTRSSSSVPSS